MTEVMNQIELARKEMELHEKYGDIEVLAINNKLFEGFNTFVKVKKENNYNTIFNKSGIFIPRYKAELDPSYRQIIPYCLVKCEDSYYITCRLEGDERLTGKYALGVGGHIERVDGVDGDYIKSGMMRELDEEIDIQSNIKSIDLIGLICSNNTEVDKTHVGLVYVITLDEKNVDVKEIDTLIGAWIDKSSLLNFKGELESWSQICVKEFLFNE